MTIFKLLIEISVERQNIVLTSTLTNRPLFAELAETLAALVQTYKVPVPMTPADNLYQN